MLELKVALTIAQLFAQVQPLKKSLVHPLKSTVLTDLQQHAMLELKLASTIAQLGAQPQPLNLHQLSVVQRLSLAPTDVFYSAILEP